MRPSVYDPFASLTLEHVRDSADRPITVTSLRQLREVEKEHHCYALVSNVEEKDFDSPPQHKPGNAFDELTRQGRWLHPDVGPKMYQEMLANGEIY